MAEVKKSTRKVEKGIAHVHSSFNNTIVTITTAHELKTKIIIS